MGKWPWILLDGLTCEKGGTSANPDGCSAHVFAARAASGAKRGAFSGRRRAVELDPHAEGKLRKWLHTDEERRRSSTQEACTLGSLAGVLAEPTSAFARVVKRESD